jgi:hypothetical protein
VGHIRGLFAWLGTRFGDHSWLLRMLFGEGEFLPYSWLLTYFARIVCEEPAIINPLCRNILFQIGGPERGQFNNVCLLKIQQLNFSLLNENLLIKYF